MSLATGADLELFGNGGFFYTHVPQVTPTLIDHTHQCNNVVQVHAHCVLFSIMLTIVIASLLVLLLELPPSLVDLNDEVPTEKEKGGSRERGVQRKGGPEKLRGVHCRSAPHKGKL